MPRQFIFQVSWRLRKKVADWLDKGKGNWWFGRLRQRVALKKRGYAVWPPPKRPPRRHRFPAWVFQQGPYWLGAILLRRKKLKARWVAAWPPPRRAPGRRHRFPSWLVQQGAYWWRRKKKPPPLVIPAPHRGRRKTAGWLATLPPVVTYVPHRRKRRQAAAAAIKRAHKKLAGWLDPGKGPWWLKPLSLRPSIRARRYAIWPLPRRAPTRQHRFPSWLFQQGAYWVSNVRLRRKQRLNRTFLPPAPRRAPTRLHRFPSWLYQQGAWWLKPLSSRAGQRAKRSAIWPAPRRAPTRRHRFPAWLVQQGAYWTHRHKPRRVPSWPLAQKRHRKAAGWLVPQPAVYTPHRRRHRQFAAFPAPRGRFPHRRGATWIPAGFAPPPSVYTPKRRIHDRRWLVKPRPRRHAQKNIVWIGTTQPGMAPAWWITRRGAAGEAVSVSIGTGPNMTYQTRLRALYLVVSGGSAGAATAVVRDGPANGGTIIFEADLSTAANSWDFLDYNGIDLRATAGRVLTVEFVAGTPGDFQEVNAEGDYVAPGTLYGVG